MGFIIKPMVTEKMTKLTDKSSEDKVVKHKGEKRTHDINETHNKVVTDINRIEGLEVEYFEIVDGNTLLDVRSWEDSSYIVGCITVYCGKTPIRLIDHIKYRG